MARYIVKQADGLLAIYSSTVSQLIAWNHTPAQMRALLLSQAKADIAERVNKAIRHGEEVRWEDLPQEVRDQTQKRNWRG